MSFAQVLSAYITLNVLVAVGFLGLRLRGMIGQRKDTAMSAAAELKLHYRIIVAIGAIALLHPLFPRSEIFEPAIKVWTAQSIHSFPVDYKASDTGGYLIVPSPKGHYSMQADQVSVSLAIIALIVTLIGFLRVGRDIYSLIRIRRRSFRIRKLGSINIFLNEHIQVPFSSWLPGRSDVVIPTSLFSKFKNFKIAVAHELQHHRQGDTKWVYGMWALKVLCMANPFAYFWCRWISELQEFACDETLVDQNKVESQQYARCLIEVAETANNQKYIPACATGLVFLIERNLLKRRIERMINVNTKTRRRSISLSFGFVIMALMAGFAYASSGFVQDRRVTMADAQRLAASARQDTDFPIVVNDLVLHQLNRFVGTPEGREYMRKALKRMENYQALVESKIEQYRLPAELAVIPIMESGYQNLELSPNTSHGAGVWMFIASTARKFGLRVDDKVDDRMNVELETDAAMRLLKADRLLFNDWLLSILGYGHGDTQVQRLIDKTGSRDAWTLVRAGFPSQPDYLPKIMAAVIIMKSPASVE